jgi:predicted RNA-binding Zn-ribbon protein involved in translation (DUF1610 family)
MRDDATTPRDDEGVRCASCGTVFQPRRSDATTCGPACRQRVYRNRACRAKLQNRIERAKREMQDAERKLAALDDGSAVICD